MKKTISIIAICVCCLLLIACAQTSALSDSEVAARRANYPVLEKPSTAILSSTEIDRSTFDHVKELYRKEQCIAVVTVNSVASYAIEESPAEGVAAQKMNRVFLNVHVDQILAQQTGVQIDESITLFLGTREKYGDQLDFASGTKLLVAFNPPPEGVIFPEVEHFYGCLTQSAFYVTSDGYVLSLFDFPGTREMDGLSVESFRSKVKNVYR